MAKQELKVLTIDKDLDSNLCLAITNSGEQCRNKPLSGSRYCRIESHQALEQKPSGDDEQDFEPCGHVNRHFIDSTGEGRILKCTKPKGHDGNHGGWYYIIEYNAMRDEYNPKIITYHKGWEGEKWGEWNDMAGIPREKVKDAIGVVEEEMNKKPGILDRIAALNEDFWADEELP